ncbi:MAG: hypothetical protein ACD_85C00002G0006 [uncultured bacterium]|nr:MAG: hypothetical protein ACD_85C00002G0006 [uncultured bacterium]
MTRTVPEGYLVRGVSSLYNKDGKLSAQWVKSSIDQQRQAEMQKAAYAAMAEELPRLGVLAPVTSTQTNLCTVYTFTDSHVGMLAWHEEGGADWDLKIAEATLVGCFERMVASSPAAKECVIAQLGDFLHYDSAVSSVTPMHGHILDADGRMPKMVKVAIRVLRRLVDIALQKHEKVILLLAEGNHDISSSVWLRAMFQALYELEPRIEVIDSELPYYTHQHGETMLAWHHGHLSKNEALPILFASQFPKIWGNTTKRYAHTGHRHHAHEKEHSGMTVIQHPTLAARDAYAARGGWMAERTATAITYHSKYGQVARTTVIPEMLEEA